ncbi:HAD hydrolase-like protein [Arthrobacter sp. efr-133-TYG-118]|uniref:HAD hydrolase-like protein n=1 Tax=Arthrobacter sp. efr-133-TYG-118 TaxID=3040279 RepID=UPI0025511729|nr:HAD hydrolase-like protein [Arthrobacter sp. efr-133-TYG-118]
MGGVDLGRRQVEGHRAVELTGVIDVREVLAAGDTMNDLKAARNVGVTAVGVLTGKLGRGNSPHTRTITSGRGSKIFRPCWLDSQRPDDKAAVLSSAVGMEDWTG